MDPKNATGEKNGKEKLVTADIPPDVAEIRIDVPDTPIYSKTEPPSRSDTKPQSAKNNDVKKQDNKRSATLTKKNSFDRSFDSDKGNSGNGKGRLRKERSFESAKKDSPGGRNSDGKNNSGKSGGGRNPKLGRRMGSEEGAKSEGEGNSRLRRQTSQEEAESSQRRRANAKKFLLRSQPVSDDMSPPSTPELNFGEDDKRIRRLPHQLSGETPSNRVHKQASLEARSEPALSREPSQEREIYTDSSGVDLHQFIVDTLQKANDRTMLLKLENELTRFIQSDEHMLKFPPMTSYHRMIVHRVAAYFGLDHNVDQSGKAVVVNKTPNTRIPEQKFREHIKEEPLESTAKKILKRDTTSFDDKDEEGRDRGDLKDDKRSKSFEERHEEYEKARARIFNQEVNTPEGLTVEPSLNRPKSILQASSRQNSGTSDDSSSSHWQKDRPWSSVDSSGSERPSIPAVTKASSFAGSLSQKVLLRTDSSASSRSSSSLGSRGSLGKLHPMDSLDRGASSPHGQARGFPSGFPYQPTLGPISQAPPAPSQLPQQATSPYSSQPSLQQGPQVTWTSSFPMSVGSQAFQSQPQLHPLAAAAQQQQQQQQAGQPHTHTGVPLIVQQGGMPQHAGPGIGQPVLFATSNIENVPPGSFIINPQTGSPFLNQDGTPMVVQAPAHPQSPSSNQIQANPSGHTLPTQTGSQLAASQGSLAQHSPSMVSSSSHPALMGFGQSLGGASGVGGFGQTPNQQGVLHPSYQAHQHHGQQQAAAMVPHQHSGEFPDINTQLQGMSLTRQISGGDSDPLPSGQHIPLSLQQQQGGVPAQSSQPTLPHPGPHPHHQQQPQPPILQIQSQQGVTQPFMVRQLSGGTGGGGGGAGGGGGGGGAGGSAGGIPSSPQGMHPHSPSTQQPPSHHPGQQPQGLGQQQGIPQSHPQVLYSGQPQQATAYRPSSASQLYSPQAVQGMPLSQAHGQHPVSASQPPQLVQPTGGIMYPSSQHGGGATTPQGYYTAQGFPGMGMVSPQQPPGGQQPGQPQIVYQSPIDQQQQQPSSSSHQGVPVLYQPQLHQAGGAPPPPSHYGPTLASPGEVPRTTSPSSQPIHGMTVVVGGQQQQQQQLMSQGPGMLTNQRPQSPQVIGPGVSYPQSVPSTGPGSTAGQGLLSQMGYNPLQQRRGLAGQARDTFATGIGVGMLPQGIQSPGTSPSQSPGPTLQRPGVLDKGMRPSKSSKQSKAPRRQRKVQPGDSLMVSESLEPHGPTELLEICALSADTTCGALLASLDDLLRLGADLRWLPNATPASQALQSHQVDSADRCANYVVLAIFPVTEAAQSALSRPMNPIYVLRSPERDHSMRLSLASSSSSSSPSPLPPIS